MKNLSSIHKRGSYTDVREPRRVFVLGVQGFKALRCTRIILAGIEVMHMSKKGQLDCPKAQASSATSQF